ncbi:MAG: 3-phosphoshikimate 1-carboxyvinyltransferase [Clostridia bacterium]|nr:3-phosphoshikimate 1-carboxyvinyltransferase [Clostridia bacterium]
MNHVQIKGGSFLKGRVKIPPSKSLSHRSIIAAALSEGKCTVKNIMMSKDIQVTTNCMKNLGAKLTYQDHVMKIDGLGNHFNLIDSVMDCHESGSTLRFMIPIGLLTHEELTFIGTGQLVFRPLRPYFDIFDAQNISYTYNQQLPLTVKGPLQPGRFQLPGDISSQFITGLLYALPLLDGPSEIQITTSLESKGYIDLTLDVLEKYGIQVINEDYKKFIIPGSQSYQAVDYKVEGDFSQVAFWLVAGLINGDIICSDMNKNSRQGDREVLEIIEKMSGHYTFEADEIHVKKQSLKCTVIDGSQCPDIIPVLTVLAAVSEGETRIVNAERLRIKECDRLKAISTELNKLGADIEELEDGLIIRGVRALKGGRVKGWNDHRIVMSLAVAALVCQEDVYIEGCDAITKSYPHFFEDYKTLGGIFNEWHLEA